METAASHGKIILCPGQGAQIVGMGRKWYDASPEARAVFDKADAVLGNRLGAPLSSICFSGPDARLNQTDVSQPAIFVTGVACWRALLASWGAGASGSGVGITEGRVVATAGLSLGEYTALHIAGAFSFEDGLELVTLRGRAMQNAADAIRLPDGSAGSGMVALIGADEAQANEICQKSIAGTSDVLVPANFNAPGQIVISGSIAACRRAADVAAAMGLRATALPVAGAFHSPLMAPAAERLAVALKSTSVRVPGCPVASNVTGTVHAPMGQMSVEDSIRRRLVEQLTQPVRWAENCAHLLKTVPGTPHELAPGKTLAGLMRRIDKAAKVETHDEP